MSKYRPTEVDGFKAAISEREFQKQIIDLAHLCGWFVSHFRTARKVDGSWVTPVEADGVGFPDLVLVRDRVIYAEVKSEKGKLTLDQAIWLALLRDVAGQEVWEWRPSDWESIVRILE